MKSAIDFFCTHTETQESQNTVMSKLVAMLESADSQYQYLVTIVDSRLYAVPIKSSKDLTHLCIYSHGDLRSPSTRRRRGTLLFRKDLNLLPAKIASLKAKDLVGCVATLESNDLILSGIFGHAQC